MFKDVFEYLDRPIIVFMEPKVTACRGLRPIQLCIDDCVAGMDQGDSGLKMKTIETGALGHDCASWRIPMSRLFAPIAIGLFMTL
jgi:hypothetical protein